MRKRSPNLTLAELNDALNRWEDVCHRLRLKQMTMRPQPLQNLIYAQAQAQRHQAHVALAAYYAQHKSK